MKRQLSMKGRLGRLALSLGLTIILLEVLLRFVWIFPFTAKGAFLCRDEVADHSHYEYGVGRMRAREFNIVVRMNNIGMRDDDVAPRKAPGVLTRIWNWMGFGKDEI
jgi:hypothetical protein